MAILDKEIRWALVADGSRALVLADRGVRAAPELHVITKATLANPPTRDQGTERPGRVGASDPGSARRASVEATDWHNLEEKEFARALAQALNSAVEQGAFDSLTVVAPPAVLGDLRKAFSQAVKERIAIELDKDLTRHPIDRMETLIADAWAKRSGA